MKNKTISDFVASSMHDFLNSDEHKSLFKTQYKTASSKDAACAKCGAAEADTCSCDAAEAHDRINPQPEFPEEMFNPQPEPPEDMFNPQPEPPSSQSPDALKVAIDNLLTASAVLDAFNMPGKSALILKVASLVVEAKKKMNTKQKAALLKRLNKGKKPAKSDKAKSSKPLTSKDFKQMLKKDDDGKLTSKNFKEHMSSKSK